MGKPKFEPEALKALKTKRNLSAQALSDLSDVPLSTINRILRGDGEPNINTVAALVHALGGSLDDVCGFPKRESAESSEGYKMLVEHQREVIAEKRHWIKILAGALAIVMTVFIGIVIYDLTHLDRGWIQMGYTGGMSSVLAAITDWFQS